MDVTAISLQGLERAQGSFERAADRMASAGQPMDVVNLDLVNPDVVDLSTAAVDLLTARQDFTLNLRVLESSQQMQRETLDLLA